MFDSIDRMMRTLAPSRVRSCYFLRVRGLLPVYMISFPKCGRTWLRLMMGKALWHSAGRGDVAGPDDLLNLDEPLRRHGIPSLQIMHEDSPDWKRAGELARDKSHHRRHKLIFLVRDPRDVVVSLYFEHTRRVGLYLESLRADPAMKDLSDRLKPYTGTIHEFLREETGSLATIIEYFNILSACRDQVGGYLQVRYEDMQLQPAVELRRVLDFIGARGIPQHILDEAVRYASFERMHEMERTGATSSYVLRAADPNDPRTFKTREGKVGGYRQHLRPEDVDWMNALIAAKLSPELGYCQEGPEGGQATR